MVRVKHRYILFNIYYPSAPSVEALPAERKRSGSSKHLLFTAPSSPQLTSQALASIIRESIGINFGDWGSGVAGSLAVKYFSHTTSTGIVRIAREHCRIVWAALTFIREVQGREAVIAVSHVSGTIKKVEEFAIKQANESIYRATNAASKPIAMPTIEFSDDEDVEEERGTS